MNTSYIKSLKTPIAIIGMGKSGKAALKLLLECGFNNEQILTFDEKDTAAKFTNHQDLLLHNPKTLVVSPGVPLKTKWIGDCLSKGAHLTSEISLAASLLTEEKLIGVTGSVGKSTVTSLLGLGASAVYENVFVGGNLGTPFCEYALQLLTGGPRASWVILELSSYQLENCHFLNLDYSIVTFLSANHLERYSSLEEYYRVKLKITEITKNICVFNLSSVDCEKYAPLSKSKFELINAKNFSFSGLLSSILLIGQHNKDNFALAAETAKLCGWPVESISAMSQFHGLAHRLEYVVQIRGVSFVNDSKATAMDSVMVAAEACLEKIQTKNRLFLLLGGKDKNLPWEQLSVFNNDARIVPVFFGECAQLAKTKTKLSGECFDRLGTAINYCQKRSSSGDTVLLSPGGTSLDEFKNFEERGDFFKSIILSDFEA